MKVTFKKDTLPRVTFNKVNYNLNTAAGARSLAQAIIHESKSALTKGEIKRQKEILNYIEGYFKKSHSTFEPQHKLVPIMMMLNALCQQDSAAMHNITNRIASLGDSASNKYSQALFQGKRPFFSSGIFNIYKMCVETVSGHRPESFFGSPGPSRLKKQQKLVKHKLAFFARAHIKGTNDFFNAFPVGDNGSEILLSRMPLNNAEDKVALQERGLPGLVLTYVEPWELTGVETALSDQTLQPSHWQALARDKPDLDHAIVEAGVNLKSSHKNVTVHGLHATNDESKTDDTAGIGAKLIQVHLSVVDYAVVGADTESKSTTANSYLQTQAVIFELAVKAIEKGGKILSHCKSGCGRSLELPLALMAYHNLMKHYHNDASYITPHVISHAINEAYKTIAKVRDISTDKGRIVSAGQILQTVLDNRRVKAREASTEQTAGPSRS